MAWLRHWGSCIQQNKARLSRGSLSATKVSLFHREAFLCFLVLEIILWKNISNSNTNTTHNHTLKEYYAVCHYFNRKQIHSYSNAFSICIWSNLKYPKRSLWGNLNSTLIPLFSCHLCCLPSFLTFLIDN